MAATAPKTSASGLRRLAAASGVGAPVGSLDSVGEAESSVAVGVRRVLLRVTVELEPLVGAVVGAAVVAEPEREVGALEEVAAAEDEAAAEDCAVPPVMANCCE